MSLVKGDHLVIKRDGRVLTPDAGEAYHEFDVLNTPVATSYHSDGTLLEAGEEVEESDELIHGHAVKLKVIK